MTTKDKVTNVIDWKLQIIHVIAFTFGVAVAKAVQDQKQSDVWLHGLGTINSVYNQSVPEVQPAPHSLPQSTEPSSTVPRRSFIPKLNHRGEKTDAHVKDVKQTESGPSLSLQDLYNSSQDTKPSKLQVEQVAKMSPEERIQKCSELQLDYFTD